jgi:hypothetical protein
MLHSDWRWPSSPQTRPKFRRTTLFWVADPSMAPSFPHIQSREIGACSYVWVVLSCSLCSVVNGDSTGDYVTKLDQPDVHQIAGTHRYSFLRPYGYMPLLARLRGPRQVTTRIFSGYVKHDLQHFISAPCGYLLPVLPTNPPYLLPVSW